MITSLKDSEVFVFGSNIQGNHAGGAANYAFENFGAEYGVGEGLTGRCYAFPTLNENMQRYVGSELFGIRDTFYRCVQAHPELTFLLTKVGCGIAGYPEEDIQELFKDAGRFTNIVLPADWKKEER